MYEDEGFFNVQLIAVRSLLGRQMKYECLKGLI
jgi:hypothetical protein